MKTFVVLALDTRVPKADGTCPIVLRIIHHEKPAQIPTGFFVKVSDWNKEARCVKPSFRGTESVSRLNNQLQKKKTAALDLIAKLDERKTLDTFSVLQLKQLIEKKPERTSFFAYAQSLITELKEAKRIGTARAYEDAIAAVKNFVGNRDVTFIELNLELLQKLEVNHLKKGNSYNGLAAYLRSVRAIYNKAIKARLVDKELYPFAEYEIKTTATRKRAISVAAIRRIESKEFAVGHPLFHTRNFFLASLYLRGMPFADLAHLQIVNIIDGRIVYERQKTGKHFSIKIQSKLEPILDFYTSEKVFSDYIFPIIKRATTEEQYKDVEEARRRFNKKLRKLAKACDIQENLTSYVSRHSFATIAKNKGIDTASISDMLGHGDIKTTQVYLDDLPNELLDDLHEKIIE